MTPSVDICVRGGGGGGGFLGPRRLCAGHGPNQCHPSSVVPLPCLGPGLGKGGGSSAGGPSSSAGPIHTPLAPKPFQGAVVVLSPANTEGMFARHARHPSQCSGHPSQRFTPKHHSLLQPRLPNPCRLQGPHVGGMATSPLGPRSSRGRAQDYQCPPPPPPPPACPPPPQSHTPAPASCN